MIVVYCWIDRQTQPPAPYRIKNQWSLKNPQDVSKKSMKKGESKGETDFILLLRNSWIINKPNVVIFFLGISENVWGGKNFQGCG